MATVQMKQAACALLFAALATTAWAQTAPPGCTAAAPTDNLYGLGFSVFNETCASAGFNTAEEFFDALSTTSLSSLNPDYTDQAEADLNAPAPIFLDTNLGLNRV